MRLVTIIIRGKREIYNIYIHVTLYSIKLRPSVYLKKSIFLMYFVFMSIGGVLKQKRIA